MPPDNEVLSHSTGLNAGEARQSLGLWDTVSVIVGIVIGAGMYETAPLVLANVSSPTAALFAWIAGGLLSLVGACCYAELASTYPNSGGDYVYLQRAYGPFVAYLFGWAQLAILMTGSIGMLAYVFADYAVAGFRLPARLSSVLAGVVVVALTLLNALSIALGKRAQNLLTVVKLVGILIVILTGLLLVPDARAAVAGSGMSAAAPTGSFPLAMILVLYTFGGWNDAAFVAAEVRDRARNLPRALLLGTLLITLVYVLINASFVHGLGFERARTSKAIAVELLEHALGAPAALLISLLIMVSALSAANALIFTGSRVHASLGKDFRALSPLGQWHARFGTPIHALLAQASVTLLLIAMLGTRLGQNSLDWLLIRLGLPGAAWSGRGGFDTLLRCTAPLFWAFFGLSAVSTIVLRVRERERPRPFKVPLYPLLPLVFAGTCLFMLVAAVEYAGSLTVVGLVPVLLGMPLYFVSVHSFRHRSVRDAESGAHQTMLQPQETIHEAIRH